MRALALTPYPIEAAAARFRLYGFVPYLARRGIDLEIRPLLDGATFSALYQRSAIPRVLVGLLRGLCGRAVDVLRAGNFDVVVVQRDAALIGPPVMEWLSTQSRRLPLVLDLDDATYSRGSDGAHGPLAQLLKWPSKTDTLIRWASVATCGNETVATYVRSRGTPTVVVPTVVPTDLYRPRPDSDEHQMPVVGWIGSHSTYPYLQTVFPAVKELARSYEFMLRVVGSGSSGVEASSLGCDVEYRAWNLAEEPEEFRSLDIGLYPLPDDAWAAGKSGLKAIEYMASGVAFVTSPVGAATALGREGITHLCASTTEQWVTELGRLMSDPAFRARMGSEGRRHALENYTVEQTAARFAQALEMAQSLGGC